LTVVPPALKTGPFVCTVHNSGRVYVHVGDQSDTATADEVANTDAMFERHLTMPFAREYIQEQIS
jgi:hypothetical protein